MDLQDVKPEFYSNKEQPAPEKFHLRGVSPLKVFPPEDDA